MGSTGRIALLRGINVGGHRMLRMATLVELFESAGCGDVATYLQSGNVVFSEPDPPRTELSSVLEQQIRATVGLDVAVVVRSAAQWRAVVAGAPFPRDDPTKLHVACLGGPLPPGAAEQLAEAAFGTEELAVAGDHIYLYLPDGMGRARLPRAFGGWRVPVTVRNWRTVTELAALVPADRSP